MPEKKLSVQEQLPLQQQQQQHHQHLLLLLKQRLPLHQLLKQQHQYLKRNQMKKQARIIQSRSADQ